MFPTSRKRDRGDLSFAHAWLRMSNGVEIILHDGLCSVVVILFSVVHSVFQGRMAEKFFTHRLASSQARRFPVLLK